MKRIPILPTLIVLAACAIMIRLGFWQIGRLHQKEAMLARYEAAIDAKAVVQFPIDEAQTSAVLYRRSEVVCINPSADRPKSGENAAGLAGWAHVFGCTGTYGTPATIVLGWSADPRPRTFNGGRVSGVIAYGPRLVVVDPALSAAAGLQPNAMPDPRDLPNNHLAYAVQWFAFAAVALVIYGLAVRKRLQG